MENKVKDFRKAADWTQADLAKRLNVSRQTIVAIEKGKYDPSLPLAFQLAQIFDSKIEEMFLFHG